MPMPPALCGRNEATSVHRNGVAHRNAVTSISPPTMRLLRFMAGTAPLRGAQIHDAPLEWRAPSHDQLAAWAPRSMVLSDTTDIASRNDTDRRLAAAALPAAKFSCACSKM